VPHAGLALLRQLARRTDLTGALLAAATGHDRGRVLADPACAADGGGLIGDCPVTSDQRQLFGLVTSVPAAWRTPKTIAGNGPEQMPKVLSQPGSSPALPGDAADGSITI
jgi:hypothetical protein